MSIINNALSGTLAAQIAMDATSQNVANLKTVGYTRQGALLAALGPSGNLSSAGRGVEVSSLLRFSDSYKTHQMWRAASDLGQRTLMQPYLTQLEQVMSNSTSGISSGLDEFFSALNAASVDPTSSPLRQQVITAAQSMAQQFNSLNDVMYNQRLSVQQQRTATVTQINGLSQDVALLNRKISELGATGANVSTLVDARDQGIDQLASLVAVQVIDQPDGSRTVSLKTGQPLVLGSSSSTMQVQNNPDGSQSLKVVYGNETFALDGTRLGGQLGGLSEYEVNVLLPQKQAVADIAGELANKVNTQLGLGFALDGSAGSALFDFNAASTNGMLKVNAGATAAGLAFSADGTSGNSSNLQSLIGIRTQPITVAAIGSVLMGDADTQLVGRLGMLSKANQSLLSTAETVRLQAEESWKSTSGVNADEEAMNLVEMQKMYNANMKVISVANSLFDSTLAMMG